MLCMSKINYCYMEECEQPCAGFGLCKKHYMRWYRYGDPAATPRFDPLHIRFWKYVEKQSEEGCWNWTGAATRGYGAFAISQRPTVAVRAHRFSYELEYGKIPDGLTIDHLCRNKSCVNPKHLEAVTPKVNVLRGDTITAANAKKTHCIHGHKFTKENTHITPRGARRCRACERYRVRFYRTRAHS